MVLHTCPLHTSAAIIRCPETIQNEAITNDFCKSFVPRTELKADVNDDDDDSPGQGKEGESRKIECAVCGFWTISTYKGRHFTVITPTSISYL